MKQSGSQVHKKRQALGKIVSFHYLRFSSRHVQPRNENLLTCQCHHMLISNKQKNTCCELVKIFYPKDALVVPGERMFISFVALVGE